MSPLLQRLLDRVVDRHPVLVAVWAGVPLHTLSERSGERG